uniref:PIN domain-containing protein n=1 Tax=Brachyspira catarrhinii TaxID=2528966 RepID=UPI003F4C616C
MSDNKKNYIFIDTNIYFSEKKSNLLNKLEKISKKYNIIIPSVQLHELQSHIADNCNRKNNFEQALYNLSEQYRDENSYPDDLKKLAKQLKEDANKLHDKLINNRKNIVKEIFDFLGKQEIIPFSAENFVGAENRVNSERAPYRNKKDGNKKHSHYDSMIWESLLYCKKLENSTLYIYDKDGDFLNDDKDDINGLLKTEWELIQKGKLILYKYDGKSENEEYNEEETNNQEYIHQENTIIERVADDNYIYYYLDNAINRAKYIINSIRLKYRRKIQQRIYYIEKFEELDNILNNIENTYIPYNIMIEFNNIIQNIKDERDLLYRRIFRDPNYFLND